MRRPHSLSTKAHVCELYIGAGKQIKEIKEIMALSEASISSIISEYFKKPDHSMVLLSDVNKEFDQRFITENWNKLSTHDIADYLGLSDTQVCRRGKKYKLPPKKIVYDKNFTRRPVMYNIIIDFETGIFYDSAGLLARALNRKKSTVQHWVSGYRNKKNKRFFAV